MTLSAAVALQASLGITSLAGDGGEAQQPAERERQEGEDRWVPSLSITAGATIQDQKGAALSYVDSNEDGSPSPGEPGIRCPDVDPLSTDPRDCTVEGNDLAASPFVGGSLELMTPALPVPTRPRLFVSGEILPTFASDRDLALEGDPGSCIRPPDADPATPCVQTEIDEGLKRRTDITRFSEDAAVGQGTSLTASVDTLVFGAKLGVAWPFRIGKRQLRIKPSVGWIQYEVEAEGYVVDAQCEPAIQCTNTYVQSPPFPVASYGYFRERILEASSSRRFNGIGPGLDLEVDTGRFGPIGTSLFLGGGAYHVLGKRSFSFSAEEYFPAIARNPADPRYGSDPIALDAETDVAEFSVEVDPWVYRAHVGIRLQWLGSPR